MTSTPKVYIVQHYNHTYEKNLNLNISRRNLKPYHELI